MKTINQIYQNELIIKNSRFICYLIPLPDPSIKELLNGIKEEHPKATHYCYAYIYDEEAHSSDDGEPSNTAGLPMLNVLQKEDFNHVLVVVVRYFGGIKLGAGGLVRAYTKSVTETLKNIDIIELELGYQIQIDFPYEEEKNINYLFKDSFIIKKEYASNITYLVDVNENTLSKLDKYSYKIIAEKYIKKI